MTYRPVSGAYLVDGKDCEDGPALESFERREAVVECLEDPLFARLVSLHALDLLLVEPTTCPADDDRRRRALLLAAGSRDAAVSRTHCTDSRHVTSRLHVSRCCRSEAAMIT